MYRVGAFDCRGGIGFRVSDLGTPLQKADSILDLNLKAFCAMHSSMPDRTLEKSWRSQPAARQGNHRAAFENPTILQTRNPKSKGLTGLSLRGLGFSRAGACDFRRGRVQGFGFRDSSTKVGWHLGKPVGCYRAPGFQGSSV